MHNAFNGPYRQHAGETSEVELRVRPRHAPLRAIELLAAFGLATAMVLGVWDKGDLAAGGYGMAIVFGVSPLLLVAAAQRVRGSIRLAALAAMIAAVSARLAWCLSAATVFAGFALVAAFAVALRARRATVLETAASVLCAVPRLPGRILALVTGVCGAVGGTALRRTKVLPIVVPLALTALFAGVFALANPVVGSVVARTWTRIAGFGLPSAYQLVIWVAAAIASVPLLRPALVFRKDDDTLAVSDVASSTSLLVARNALVALNAIFAAYNALDVAHLWAGSPPSGMSTQAYAHHGAVWLTVALAMLTAVVSVLFRGSVATDPNGKLARVLGFAWIAQGGLLATGTYRRIGIHITTSGLSSLRIAGIMGTTVVVLGLFFVAYKLFARRSTMWLVRRQLDSVAVALVLFAIAPTHLLGARLNVERVSRGEYRPLVHIYEQAREEESAAALLPLLDHPDVRVRQGVACYLQLEHGSLRHERARPSSFFARDLASARAFTALDARARDLEELVGTREKNPSVNGCSVLENLQLAANRDESLDSVKPMPPPIR